MIRISISSYPSFGKWLILGNYLSNKEREIQEKLETIYAFLWLRITIITYTENVIPRIDLAKEFYNLS